jgi:RimJ/RimL family protein N-acetyltransferase
VKQVEGLRVFPDIVVGQDAGVGLELRLLTRREADRVIARRRDPAADPPWASEYPLDGDIRAAAAYASHLPVSSGADAVDVFGYYQVLEDGLVVGGIGFHGPPSGHVVEVGYGVVPSVRGRGVATQALRILLNVAAGLEGVRRVVGRTEDANLASQGVMRAAGMRLVGRDPDFLHFEIDLEGGAAAGGRQAGADPGDQRR